MNWDCFGESLIRGLKDEKVRGNFVDVCIALSSGEVIHANKLVLAIASSFFSDIFKAHAHPYPLINIPQLTLDDLNSLIEFMYSGEVKVSEDRLESFLKAANTLGVRGLVSKGKEEDDIEARDNTGRGKSGEKNGEKPPGEETFGEESTRGKSIEDKFENTGVKSAGDVNSGEGQRIETLRGAELNRRLETFCINAGPDKFLCSKCGTCIKTKRKVILHIERHMNLTFACTLCSTVTRTRNALVEHAREKHDVKIGSQV